MLVIIKKMEIQKGADKIQVVSVSTFTFYSFKDCKYEVLVTSLENLSTRVNTHTYT